MELEPACNDFSCIWQAAVRTQSTHVGKMSTQDWNLSLPGYMRTKASPPGLSLGLLTTQLECPLHATYLSTLTQMEQTFLMVLGLNNCWDQPPPYRDGPKVTVTIRWIICMASGKRSPLSSTLALEGVSNQSFKPHFGNIDAILIRLHLI